MQVQNEFLALAQRLADTAGEILRRHFGQQLAVEDKADKSPVTAADREVETAMREMIEQAFPEHGIFGEEHGRVRESSPWQWVLDPIDGTRAFIAGQPTFTTLIALAYDGIPLLGIIDQPITKERWVGIREKASTLNGEPIKPSTVDNIGRALLATTSMNYFTASERTAFEALRTQCKEQKPAADAYLYGQLAGGKLDLVVDAHLKPYDFMALAPVVENAGGIITDWDGKALRIDSDGRVIAAATRELHAKALAILIAL